MILTKQAGKLARYTSVESLARVDTRSLLEAAIWRQGCKICGGFTTLSIPRSRVASPHRPGSGAVPSERIAIPGAYRRRPVQCLPVA